MRQAQCAAAVPPAEHRGLHGGTSFKAGGIAKHGAKMVTAVACARVPKLTVVIGGSYGAGNCLDVWTRVFTSLPVDVAERAHLPVMGGEQAASGALDRS